MYSYILRENFKLKLLLILSAFKCDIPTLPFHCIQVKTSCLANIASICFLTLLMLASHHPGRILWNLIFFLHKLATIVPGLLITEHRYHVIPRALFHWLLEVGTSHQNSYFIFNLLIHSHNNVLKEKAHFYSAPFV